MDCEPVQLRSGRKGAKVEALDVSLYEPPDRPWELKLRSRQSTKRELEDVARLWRLLAEARGDDAEQIDVSYVIRRIVEAGLSQAFAEYGGRPTTEAEWEKAKQAISRAAKQSR